MIGQILVVLRDCARRMQGIAMRLARRVVRALRAATRPLPMLGGLVVDLTRSREELIAENALLRQQVIVAVRTAKRPKIVAGERWVMVILARLVPRWRDAVLLVKPETPIVWRAPRVALDFATTAAFCSGVRGVRVLRGFSPKSASVSMDPPNATSSAYRRPETNPLVFVRPSRSACTVACQVALVETVALASRYVLPGKK